MREEWGAAELHIASLGYLLRLQRNRGVIKSSKTAPGLMIAVSLFRLQGYAGHGDAVTQRKTMFLVVFIDALKGHAGHGNAIKALWKVAFVAGLLGLKGHAWQRKAVKHNGSQCFFVDLSNGMKGHAEHRNGVKHN